MQGSAWGSILVSGFAVFIVGCVVLWLACASHAMRLRCIRHVNIVAARGERPKPLVFSSAITASTTGCEECRPSARWLGLSSPKAKIRESGLWLVNERYKEPLSSVDLDRLRNRVIAGAAWAAPVSRKQDGLSRLRI
jgi:hypothetical protein